MYRDIEREPLPFFLSDANRRKLSGHLFVSAKDFQITLNLLEGKLANGMSTRFDEKLSVILHLMGGINEEQYNFLSGLHQFSDDQVAGILLDQNFAKKKDIYYARIYQLRRIAISTFALQQGKWIFTAGEADPPLRETFDIPLAGILVEGARSIDHVSVYASRWQHCIPVLFKEIPLDAEIYYTDAEREFYAAVQALGQQSCQELIARLNLVPIEFWRRLLAFHLLGIVEFAKSEESPDLGEIAALLELNRRLQEAPGAGAALLGLPASASAADFEKARAGFLARFAPERFGSGAAPEIKSIARAVCLHLRELTPGRAPWPDASTRPGLWREEATASGTPPAPAVSKPGREEKIASKPPAEIHIELPEANIFGETPSGFRLEELTADDIVIESPAEVQIERPGDRVGGETIDEPHLLSLGDEEIVLEPSVHGQIERPAETVGGRDVDEPHLLSLRDEDIIVAMTEPPTADGSGDERVVGAGEQAGPELLREEDIVGEGADESEPELLGDAELIAEPEAPLAAARADEEPLSGAEWIIDEDAAAAPAPAAMPLQVEPEIPSAAPPRPDGAASSPSCEFAPLAAPPSLRMANEDHEKAWQLLLQAKELYERHEYASAVPLLKKAIKLEPGQGDFYYLLGICQNESELSKNEAEMNLKKAIELKSWSADPVYALGVLYRGQGKMKLAERCFQRVKEIAYEHTGASRALVDLRRQKAGKPFSPHAKKRR
ncbi:MAG: hypothetical protein MUF02_05580 [Acidobacteria bacterium]|nr:hypothetical protein [Acidobacteriota bacterium]